METKSRELGTFMWRTAATHMISYFVAGIFALIFMDYGRRFESSLLALFMRPIDSPMVALGPSLQSIQGLVLALVLFPFRAVFLERKNGWLSLFVLVVGFSLFSPQLAGPGCFEGLIYSKFSIADHLSGLPETFLYAISFSFFLPLWNRNPKRLWNVIAIVAVALIFIMGLLGLLSSLGIINA